PRGRPGAVSLPPGASRAVGRAWHALPASGRNAENTSVNQGPTAFSKALRYQHQRYANLEPGSPLAGKYHEGRLGFNRGRLCGSRTGEGLPERTSHGMEQL